MSKHDSTVIENVKVLMLKGEKGDQGETYDDTEVRNLIRTQNATISDLEDLVNSYDGTMILRDLATLEDSPNGDSTHAYSAGDWLIYRSQLYESTTSIAIGDLLEEGVNLEAVTVAEVLENFQTMLDNALTNMEDTLEDFSEEQASMRTAIEDKATKEEIAEEQFKIYYGIESKTTNYTEDANGIITGIVETKSDATATSTFTISTSGTTITTTIVPTQGDYNYIKTTIIVDSDSDQAITESYNRILK